MSSEQLAHTRREVRPLWTAPDSGARPKRARHLAGWRRSLFAWLAWCEAPEALALRLPPDRVVTVEQIVEIE